MKRLFPLILLLAAVITLTACRQPTPAVISAGGKSYDILLDEDGQKVLSEEGAPIVVKQDASGNEVTEALSGKYLIVEEEKLIAPAYELEIPKDFEIKSSDSDPLLENKKGDIQINILDNTDSAGDFEEYIKDTYESFSGFASPEGLEDATVGGLPMKRFTMSIPDDDGTMMQTICYFVSVNERILLITVTSKNESITDVSQADELVAEIDFSY